LPLTEKVEFKTVLQKGNRIQIPRKIRWRFKMEPDQLLKVGVYPINSFSVSYQSFYASMTKDGRITVPRLYRLLLASEENTRYVLSVRLEPA
jgi:hypothetical protein